MSAIFFILLSFVQSAHADFSSTELTGRIRAEDQYFYGSQVAPIEHQQDNYSFEFEAKTNFGSSFRLLVEPKLQLSSTPNLVDTTLDFNPRDTYLESKFLGMHFLIGSFIKVWEGPDGYNPMDITTVKNYRDPLNPENLASTGISGGGEIGKLSWELFYVPIQTAPRLPGENSRWLPRKAPFPLKSDALTLVIPDHPDIQVAAHDELNSALKNNYGGRLQIHSESTDLFLAGFDGVAQLPIFRAKIFLEVLAGHPSNEATVKRAQIQPVDYRRQTAAVGIASQLSDTWLLRMAGRYDQSVGTDPQLPGWSQQFVGGFEKTFNLFDQTVLVFLQYAYGIKPDAAPGTLIITDPFQNAFLYGLRLPIGERFVIYYGGLWSHLMGANYDRIRFERKVFEHWTFDIEGDWIRGPSNNPLGIWANENRASLGVLYQF